MQLGRGADITTGGYSWRRRSCNPTNAEAAAHTPSGASRHLPQLSWGRRPLRRFEMCERLGAFPGILTETQAREVPKGCWRCGPPGRPCRNGGSRRETHGRGWRWSPDRSARWNRRAARECRRCGRPRAQATPRIDGSRIAASRRGTPRHAPCVNRCTCPQKMCRTATCPDFAMSRQNASGPTSPMRSRVGIPIGPGG